MDRPYIIEWILHKNVYVLDVPKRLKWHPVFHISVLKKFVANKEGFHKEKAQVPPQEEVLDQTMEQVSMIHDKKQTNIKGV